MRLGQAIKKLQTAIIKSGLVIKINRSEFYSDEQKRLITQYHICTPVMYQKKSGDWGTKDHEILKTCSAPEVIYCLVDIYEAVKKWN